MVSQISTPPVRRILKYPIASADMYYSEMDQRDIYVCDDPEKGLCIWGETPYGGGATVNLCQIFLEYALFSQSFRDTEKSYNEMRSFGERLGTMLAEYLKETPLLKGASDSGACALESVLEAIHAHLTIEHIGPELRFVVAGCPLLDVSERSGLKEMELAQYGFNVMCQNLIHSIDPNELLYTPRGGGTDQTFTILKSNQVPLERMAISSLLAPVEVKEKSEITIDAFPPPAMATKAIDIGSKKTSLDTLTTFMLAILAGAFIAMGAIFSTTVTAGGGGLPYGVVRLLAGLAFTLGLIMVVVAGSELFTGNNMIVMAFLSGKVTLGALLRNWVIVYFGNFTGAMLTAYLIFLTRQYTFGSGAIGLTVLNIGEAKTSLDFIQAIALGIGCNALVCLAVWMCYSARSTVDKILAIIPPIAAFVAAGFEHSIANMYFIPIALFVKNMGSPAFFEAIQKTPANFPHLTWTNFLVANLLPVTIGNIIGGALMVGIMYWLIYLRNTSHPTPRVLAGMARSR